MKYDSSSMLLLLIFIFVQIYSGKEIEQRQCEMIDLIKRIKCTKRTLKKREKASKDCLQANRFYKID